MNMRLLEKKKSTDQSLSQKSYVTATINMILSVEVWTAVVMIWGNINDLRENVFLLAVHFVRALEGFIFLTFIGVIVSLTPTLIGAKVLSIWLQRHIVTRKSAMIAGAVIGTTAILVVTILISAFLLISKFLTSFEDIIFLIAAFNLLSAICAGIAGGRTGLQLAKFIETQKQNIVESGQDILTPAQTKS